MESARYNVVFRGRIQTGKSPEEVKSNLARVLKNDTAKVERFFTHTPLIVKKSARLNTALSLVETFKNAGLECDLEPTDESPHGAPKLLPDEAPSEVEAKRGRTLICPQCGREQQESQECARCGIIFDKFVQSSPASGSPGAGAVPLYLSTFKGDTPKSRVGILSLTLLAVAFGAFRFWTSLDIRHPPGILVSSAPLQTIIQNPRPWVKGKRVFVPLAQFSLTARVLGKERYRYDASADICPVDLALGWGPMSDQGILDTLDIVQGSRRYMVAPLTPTPPLPISVLMQHSSNMHMIPADDETEERLKNVRAGEIIRLKGYLVGIQEAGQWVWVSSLTRNDTGDGACELVWVQELQTLPGVEPSHRITALDSRRILAQHGTNSHDGT